MTQKQQVTFFARRALVVLAHLGLWTFAYGCAFLLRFDGNVPAPLRRPAVYGLVLLLVIRSISFWFSGLFHGILRYAGIPEVRSIMRASTIATIVFVGAGVAVQPLRQPRSVYAGEWVLAILFAAGLRLVIRMLRERRQPQRTQSIKRALLIGAGDAGELFLRDLERAPRPDMVIVGILDDDEAKHGVHVRGVRVIGAPTEIVLRRASEDLDARLAVLAMPSASGSRTREILNACRASGIDAKTLPSLHQILSGDVKVSMLRDVAIEDLLRREPIELERKSMAEFLRGKRVLITGGAGSIGSELARQVCRHEPSAVALLDHNENGLFFLERELNAAFPRISISAYIGDVKDSRRVANVLRSARPHVILHAAAHKHVPLMEEHPAEAVKNNVFGTKVVADLANSYGVESFVLISTDKAVNPTSVMGATKRVSEMYVQSLSGKARTRFVAVRFGNVLGSAGSVVPVFRDQIAAGGPVTVTHPEMQRFFMTIPEACQLVLQAGALAKGGEIFLLDMGKPVKVVDLARDMIRMSGLEPDVDIPIVFTGMRPGEKLFEELLLAEEGYDRTVHPKIRVGRIAPVETARMQQCMAILRDCIDGKSDDVRYALSQIVPEAKFGGSDPPHAADVEQTLQSLETLETLVPRA